MSRIRRLYNMDLGIRQSLFRAGGGNAVHDDLVRFSLSIYPCCLKKISFTQHGIAIDRMYWRRGAGVPQPKSRVAEPAAQTLGYYKCESSLRGWSGTPPQPDVAQKAYKHIQGDIAAVVKPITTPAVASKKSV